MSDQTPMFAYNQHMLEWRQDTLDYQTAVEEEAKADAAYKVAEARLMIREKAANPKVGADFARAVALTDDAAAIAFSRKLVSEATSLGLRKKLDWDAAYADNLRTNVVNEREENRLASSFGAGGSFGSGPEQPQWSTRPPEQPRPAPTAPTPAPTASSDPTPPPRDFEPPQGHTAAPDVPPPLEPRGRIY